MGKLIIDGNSFFEIDEQCLKRKKIPKSCDIEKYLVIKEKKKEKNKQNN